MSASVVPVTQEEEAQGIGASFAKWRQRMWAAGCAGEGVSVGQARKRRRACLFTFMFPSCPVLQVSVLRDSDERLRSQEASKNNAQRRRRFEAKEHAFKCAAVYSRKPTAHTTAICPALICLPSHTLSACLPVPFALISCSWQPVYVEKAYRSSYSGDGGMLEVVACRQKQEQG